MEKIKYLFIHLKVREGEREHDHKILHTTKCENLDFAAEYYVAHFWGDADRVNDSWEAWGGEIVITLQRHKELTEEEYNYLQKFLYN